MNKSELLPIICDRLDPLLVGNGYRYLKGREKYEKKVDGVRVWLEPNVTYWASSDYCMVSPRMSVHVDAVEDVMAKHESRKLDRHTPTVTILSDNLEGAKFWTISSPEDFRSQADEIEKVIKSVCLPLLENWSDHHKLAIAIIKNGPAVIHSELHRLTVLFAYVCAFRDPEMLSAVIQSVDLVSVDRSRSQLDPHYRQVLKSMKTDVPEIGTIGVDL